MQAADLQRLIQIIVEELAARRRQGGRSAARAIRCCTSAVRIACAACSRPARRGSACTPPAARPAAWRR